MYEERLETERKCKESVYKAYNSLGLLKDLVMVECQNVQNPLHDVCSATFGIRCTSMELSWKERHKETREGTKKSDEDGTAAEKYVL